MKRTLILAAGEIRKQTARRGVLIAAAVLLLLSAALPLLVKSLHPVFQVSQDPMKNQRADYQQFEQQAEAFDRDSLAPEMQRLLDIYRRVNRELYQAAEQYQVPYSYPLFHDGEEITLFGYYQDQLTLETSQLSPNFIQSEDENARINQFFYLNFPKSSLSCPILNSYQLEALPEKHEGEASLLVSFEQPVDKKQMLGEKIEWQKASLEELRQNGRSETALLQSLEQEIDDLESSYRMGAYDPANWNYSLFNFNSLQSIRQRLDQYVEPSNLVRPISGSFTDPVTGRYYENLGALPLEEYKVLYNRARAELNADYEELLYATEHNTRPVHDTEWTSNYNDPRRLALSVVPYLIVVAAAAGVLCAFSVGREYTGGTAAGLFSRPVSRRRIASSKLLGCALLAGALVFACALAVLVVSGALCGAGGLFTNVMLRVGKGFQRIPFLLWYLGRCAALFCVSLLGVCASAVVCALTRRTLPGAVAGAALPLFIGVQAIFPGFMREWRMSHIDQAAQPLLSSSESPAHMFDWSAVYDSLIDHLEAGWWLACVLALAGALAVAAVQIVKRQAIEEI